MLNYSENERYKYAHRIIHLITLHCCQKPYNVQAKLPWKCTSIFSVSLSVLLGEFLGTDELEEVDNTEFIAPPPPPKPTDTQVGGNHYKDMKIQPLDFIEENNLSFSVGNIVKYVCRFDKKNGVEDLEKAKHYLEMLIKRNEQ